MAANFLIKCWVKPVGSEGPLVPSLLRGGPGGRVLELTQMGVERTYPKGFSVDAIMEFDLQEDGGVDQIVSYHRMGAR